MLDYYVALDSALRDQPPRVRRLLAWCRHCGIPFIADPRNVGRVDLGCPFGCADLHRRRGSNERSAEYNRSARMKLERGRQEEARRLARESSATKVSPAAEVHPVATAESHEAVSAVSGSSVEPLPRYRRVNHPCPSPELSQPTTDPATRGTEKAARHPVRRTSEDCEDSSPRERVPSANAASTPAEPERFEIDPGILAYVQFVISLFEGRPVHREEILEMLARGKRQRSFAREKRIDYVLRRLREEPEKPP